MAQVLHAVQSQQVVLDHLVEQLSTLREEHEALCECLAALGAVPAERLNVWLHRRRFSAMLRRHPVNSHESLETWAQARELTLMVAARTGMSAMVSLGSASRALRRSITAVGPELQTLFPAMLYAVGGEAGGSALSSVEIFDTARGTWTPAPPLSIPRSGCAAVAVGGMIYAVGGCSSDGEDLSSVEQFDPRAGLWQQAPPMQAGRDELAATSLDGKIYAVGGSHLVWPVRHVIGEVERFTSDSWEVLPPLRKERCAAASASVAGGVCVFGGCDEDGAALDSAECFVVSMHCWEPLPNMCRPRCNFAAAVVGGHIYVAGGYDDQMRDLDAVERLDPFAPMWEPVFTVLGVPRWGARAVGSSGVIYVVGGQARDAEVGMTDQLNLPSGVWITLASLQVPRRSFGLAALTD